MLGGGVARMQRYPVSIKTCNTLQRTRGALGFRELVRVNRGAEKACLVTAGLGAPGLA